MDRRNMIRPNAEDRQAAHWSYCVGSGRRGLNPIAMDGVATWQTSIQVTCPVCGFHEVADDDGDVIEHETPNPAGWTPKIRAEHGY